MDVPIEGCDCGYTLLVVWCGVAYGCTKWLGVYCGCTNLRKSWLLIDQYPNYTCECLKNHVKYKCIFVLIKLF